MISSEHENSLIDQENKQTPEMFDFIDKSARRIIVATLAGVAIAVFAAVYIDSKSNKTSVETTSVATEQNATEKPQPEVVAEVPTVPESQPIEAPAPTTNQVAEQTAEQPSSDNTTPATVDKLPVAPVVVAKPAVKPLAVSRPAGIFASLDAYKTVNGKKMCKLSDKEDNPSISSKGKGIHVDEDCCIDLDEIPNLNCYYAPSSSKKINSAMAKAASNITKKLGSKAKK